MDTITRLVPNGDGFRAETVRTPDLDGATWEVYMTVRCITRDVKVYESTQRIGQTQDPRELPLEIGYLKESVMFEAARDQGLGL